MVITRTNEKELHLFTLIIKIHSVHTYCVAICEVIPSSGGVIDQFLLNALALWGVSVRRAPDLWNCFFTVVVSAVLIRTDLSCFLCLLYTSDSFFAV